jgi:FHS family Na+ dependent glucose MFS transporter 1
MRRTVIGYFSAFIALGLVLSSLGPTLPDLAAQTNVTISQISFLFTARSLGFLSGSLIVGHLYDRVSGHPVIAVTLFIVALMLILVPLAPFLWLLTAVMFVLGMGESGTDVGTNTLIVWLYGDKVGPLMNGLHFFFGVGALAAPIIVAQAIRISGGIQWAYWSLALLILPPAIYLLRLPSPPIRSRATDNGRNHFNLYLFILIFLLFFTYTGAEISFGGWLFTYAVTLDLGDETIAAYLTSAFFGAFTVGRLLTIPIAARVSPAALLSANLGGGLLSLGIMLLWPDRAAAVWIGAIGFGLSIAAVFPTFLSLAERQLRLSGRITSWFFIAASLGGMTIPWLIGQFFETTGPLITMQIIFAAIVATTLIFVVLMWYTVTFATTR